MSVLLFMPESGGNPLDSVIMTSTDDFSNNSQDVATISRFGLKNGKPIRKLSSDSASLALSIQSGDITEGEDFPVLGEGGADDDDDDDDDAGSSSSSMGSDARSFRRRPLSRNPSTSTSRSAPPFHSRIADAKQPQLRLTHMGAIMGAAAPGGAKKVVKAVNKAQERRVVQASRRRAQKQQDPTSVSADDEQSKSTLSPSARVHSGFFV
jgi:hypothetical protein